MRRRELLATVPFAALGGCTIGGEPPETDGLTISAPTFENGEMPVRHTCDGEATSPPLRIEGIPDGAESLAVVGEWLRGYSPRTIWLLWELPAEPLEIPEGIDPVERPAEIDAVQGVGDDLELGYRAPCHESPEHNEYRFNVLALESTLPLDAGADRDGFDDATETEILSSTFVAAKYDRV